MKPPRNLTAAYMGDPSPSRAAGPPPPDPVRIYRAARRLVPTLPDREAPAKPLAIAQFFDEGHGPTTMDAPALTMDAKASTTIQAAEIAGQSASSGEPITYSGRAATAAGIPATEQFQPVSQLSDEIGQLATTTNLRPVAALNTNLDDFVAHAWPIPTPPPTVEWMAPTDLLVDEVYQRGLSDKSKALITKIATGWDWRRFKPPIIAWTERGFEIIDGQHTAIAAATRGIERIPVLVTEAPEVGDRALAFVGHNTDRLAVSAMQLHHAKVAAGDDDAVTIEQVCQRAGVALVRSPYGGRPWKAGETIAIDAIKSLIARRHAQRAREILQLLVEAGCAPITVNHIKAVEHLTVEPKFVEELEPWGTGGRDNILAAITALGPKADAEATVDAKQMCLPKWKALAGVVYRKTRKRRTT